MKTELPEEIKEYHNNIRINSFSIAAENVHKLKHKISILGLKKSYEIASDFLNSKIMNNFYNLVRNRVDSRINGYNYSYKLEENERQELQEKFDFFIKKTPIIDNEI